MKNRVSCCLVLLIGLVGLFLSSCAPALSNSSQGSSDLSVQGQPTITASFIDQVLADHNSPAQGMGQAFYNEGLAFDIDPAFALAFFKHESGFGLQGEARSSLSIGNVRCLASYPCKDGYAWFSSWREGIHFWFELIAGPLYVGSGLTTLSKVIGRYAPPTDGNDDVAYVQAVTQSVLAWRAGHDQ